MRVVIERCAIYFQLAAQFRGLQWCFHKPSCRCSRLTHCMMTKCMQVSVDPVAGAPTSNVVAMAYCYWALYCSFSSKHRLMAQIARYWCYATQLDVLESFHVIKVHWDVTGKIQRTANWIFGGIGMYIECRSWVSRGSIASYAYNYHAPTYSSRPLILLLQPPIPGWPWVTLCRGKFVPRVAIASTSGKCTWLEDVLNIRWCRRRILNPCFFRRAVIAHVGGNCLPFYNTSETVESTFI